MTTDRCVGLVGGLGVGAAIHYYQNLVRAYDHRASSLDLVMAHAETSRIFEYIETKNPAGMAEYLASFLHRLKAAGAEIGVIPAVTPLYCARELAAISPLPLVSIAEAVATELASRSAKRVAIFGTRYVIQSCFYGLLSKVEVVVPRPGEVATIHAVYTELLRDRRGTDAQHRQLTTLAHTLIARDNIDTILIAGTDLSLLFNQSNTDFPHIDCAAVHVSAIIQALLHDPPQR